MEIFADKVEDSVKAEILSIFDIDIILDKTIQMI